jgi:hypothetical protein
MLLTFSLSDILNDFGLHAFAANPCGYFRVMSIGAVRGKDAGI